MNNYTHNLDSFRNLSQVFSPATFHKILREDDIVHFEKKVAKFIGKSSLASNLEIIKFLYRILDKNYRCEYFYKNKLTIDIIKQYSLKNSVVVNEFKIGSSKADLVLLNGSIRVYEIKTELDSLTKLSKQLSDYQKFANKVYVVTDENYAKRLAIEYIESNIGVIAMDVKGNFSVHKEATDNNLLFDFDILFKTLRKSEYIELVKQNFGVIPDVPNTKMFKSCYNSLSGLEIEHFQNQVLQILKGRRLNSPQLLTSTKTPKELKHICNSLDLSKSEYNKLYQFLSIQKYVPTIY